MVTNWRFTEWTKVSVKDYRLVDIDTRNWYRNTYQVSMAGEASHQSNHWRIQIQDRDTVYLDAGDPTRCRYVTSSIGTPTIQVYR